VEICQLKHRRHTRGIYFTSPGHLSLFLPECKTIVAAGTLVVENVTYNDLIKAYMKSGGKILLNQQK
jgi:hypothetical protein